MSFRTTIFRGLSVLVGLFFIFSAYVKLYPIEVLEIAIVETGIIEWSLASFAARLLIGSEFFIGLLLVTNFRTKASTSLAGFSLIIFTIYLSILLVVQGNNINCNCMGLFMVMNPIESIIKNLVLIILLALIFFKNKSIHYKYEKAIILIVLILSIALPFILNPPSFHKHHQEGYRNEPYKMDFSIIYSNPKIEQPSIDLNSGKHLVGFFSSSCQHCVVTAYNLKVILEQNPELSFYFFINGDDADLAHFHTLTKSESIPHSKLPANELLTLAGNKLPALFLINNSMVEEKLKVDQIDDTSIIKWFKE